MTAARNRCPTGTRGSQTVMVLRWRSNPLAVAARRPGLGATPSGKITFKTLPQHQLSLGAPRLHLTPLSHSDAALHAGLNLQGCRLQARSACSPLQQTWSCIGDRVQRTCQGSMLQQALAAWSSGMILAQGARGPGLNSRRSPFLRSVDHRLGGLQSVAGPRWRP